MTPAIACTRATPLTSFSYGTSPSQFLAGKFVMFGEEKMALVYFV